MGRERATAREYSALPQDDAKRKGRALRGFSMGKVRKGSPARSSNPRIIAAKKGP